MSKETEVIINEYQQGIEILKRITRVPSIFINATVEKLVETFQPLVDKTTPKKPIVINEEICCPNCKSPNRLATYESYLALNYDNPHCGDCGQAIDWSKDE